MSNKNLKPHEMRALVAERVAEITNDATNCNSSRRKSPLVSLILASMELHSDNMAYYTNEVPYDSARLNNQTIRLNKLTLVELKEVLAKWLTILAELADYFNVRAYRQMKDIFPYSTNYTSNITYHIIKEEQATYYIAMDINCGDSTCSIANIPYMVYKTDKGAGATSKRLFTLLTELYPVHCDAHSHSKYNSLLKYNLEQGYYIHSITDSETGAKWYRVVYDQNKINHKDAGAHNVALIHSSIIKNITNNNYVYLSRLDYYKFTSCKALLKDYKAHGCITAYNPDHTQVTVHNTNSDSDNSCTYLDYREALINPDYKGKADNKPETFLWRDIDEEVMPLDNRYNLIARTIHDFIHIGALRYDSGYPRIAKGTNNIIFKYSHDQELLTPLAFTLEDEILTAHHHYRVLLAHPLSTVENHYSYFVHSLLDTIAQSVYYSITGKYVQNQLLFIRLVEVYMDNYKNYLTIGEIATSMANSEISKNDLTEVITDAVLHIIKHTKEV